MRIRWKVVAPALAAIGSWLASPHALSLVSEEHSHILLAVSSLILILSPALVTNKPKTSPRARNVARDVEARIRRAGVTSDDLDIPPLAKIPAKERGDL